MIKQISVRNFKSLRDVRLGLERFTILVGPNGSGKSSMLNALNGLCCVFQQPLQPGTTDAEIKKAHTRGSQHPVELAVQMLGKMCFRYHGGLKSDRHGLKGAKSSPPGRVKPPAAVASLQTATEIDFQEPGPWLPEGKRPVLPKSVLLHLSPEKLRSTTFNKHDNAAMAADGTGLHAALASMALNEPDTWQTLQTELKGIIPIIKRLRHEKMASGQVPPALQFDTVGAECLHADQVSEGTLLVVGLLAALYAPCRPNLILLDDLDRGLHPKAQKDVIALLRRLLEQNQELQIVATTHSPYLLNWTTPEEVRMTCLREDGSTVCAPITTHPKFEKWKDEMAPGEMWSLFGEKWMIGEGAVV